MYLYVLVLQTSDYFCTVIPLHIFYLFAINIPFQNLQLKCRKFWNNVQLYFSSRFKCMNREEKFTLISGLFAEVLGKNPPTRWNCGTSKKQRSLRNNKNSLSRRRFNDSNERSPWRNKDRGCRRRQTKSITTNCKNWRSHLKRRTRNCKRDSKHLPNFLINSTERRRLTKRLKT